MSDEMRKLLAARLSAILDATGPKALSRKSGVNERSLARYAKGERVPDVIKAAAIARAVGLTADDLISEPSELAEGTEPYVGPGGEFVAVAVHEVRAAGGGGALVLSEEVKTHLAFRADWIREDLRVPQERLAVIAAEGKSMAPTICEGDALLLDMKPEILFDGAIYVLERGNELKIKRPQRMPDGRLILHSDNPAWPPEDYAPEEAETWRIVGRVLWVGRKV